VGALEPMASDLTRHLAADIGSILVCGSEMQTEQHASFNDFIDDDAGLAVKPFLAGKDVSWCAGAG
jgi:hypothetical protein